MVPVLVESSPLLKNFAKMSLFLRINANLLYLFANNMSMFVDGIVIRIYNNNMGKYILAAIIIVLSACSNLTLERETISVETLSNGSILEAGESFSIEVKALSGEVSPDNIKVTIRNINPESRETLNVSPIELEVEILETDKIELYLDKNAFEDGLYEMEISVLENEEELFYIKREFIVYSKKIRKEITGIYPIANVYTHSKVLLEAKIEIDVDPYLIWSQRGKIISEGYLSQGLDSIVWNSGEIEGLHEIKLEIFPYKLKEWSNSGYGFGEYLIFNVVVNNILSPLYTDKSFHRAFLFNGNFLDEFNKNEGFSIIGEYVPMVIDGSWGVNLGPQNGILSNNSFFPQIDNKPLDFSTLLEFYHLDIQDGVIFKGTNFGYMHKLFTENGLVYYSFENNNISIYKSLLYPIELEKKENINITAIHKEDSITIRIYRNGNRILDYNTLYSPELVEDMYSLGNGNSILLNELKLFINEIFEDTTKNNIYSGNLKLRGLNGDGFNSLYLPKNFIGEGSIDGEYLLMNSDSLLDLSPYVIDGIFSINGKVTSVLPYEIILSGRSIDDLQENINLEIIHTGNFVINQKIDSLEIIGSTAGPINIKAENIFIKSVGETVIDEVVFEEFRY